MDSVAQALAHLRTLLTSGNYTAGDKLPTERELSERFGVSRRAVRKAIAFLEAEGRIWRHVGRGTFIGTRPSLGTNDITTVGQRTNPDEIMEARLALEPSTARLAALRATLEEIHYMRTCYSRCLAAEDADTYERWDSALHTTIAEASHNVLLMTVFNTINALRTDATWGQLRASDPMSEQKKRFSEQHAAVIAAIASRDPTGAHDRMAEHVLAIRAFVLSGGFADVSG